MANAQTAPRTKITLIRMCSQVQSARPETSRISLTAATRNTTPSSTPMVATDAMENRSTTTEMISQATPVTRNIHHGPASRASGPDGGRASRPDCPDWVRGVILGLPRLICLRNSEPGWSST